MCSRASSDWDDDDAATILEHARAALRPGGRLVVLELLLADDHPAGGLCDLHLRVVTGGRERTQSQLTTLFARAAFIRGCRPEGELLHVLTGEPA